jgi:AmmeMemoRadiSam system protein A
MTPFSAAEQDTLLQLARETIRHLLETGQAPELPPAPAPFREKRGVFVTCHRHGDLRGCIGYPLPVKPLWAAVADNAIAAATQDPRFPPVTRNELDELDIEISVLTVPVKVAGPEQVEVGRDGILITSGYHRGLLLPQVPLEWGWDREEFLTHGCVKAGLPADQWRRGVTIETFQAEVFGEKDRPVAG